MQTDPLERPVPYTSNRAWTELVKSRQQVDSARRALELALGIFRSLDDDPPVIPLPALEHVLGQLEDVEASLWEAAQ